MIKTLVLFGHLLVAGLIIVLVLLQRGKGADAGTGFGAGASGTVFGARGSASFFSRATAVLAAMFFATSLALAYFATQQTEPDSLIDDAGAGTGGPGLVPISGEDETTPIPEPDAGDTPTLDPGAILEDADQSEASDDPPE